jgi:uncharacterized protein (DUF433 family)
METTQAVKILGRFIVADPKVCHGQPTFRGTRIFVADVLEQVARGLDWETIIEEWHGSITHEAIAEAAHLDKFYAPDVSASEGRSKQKAKNG